MQSRELQPPDFQTASDLSKLPYLTRDIIRQEGDRLRADNYPDEVCQFRRSGGTTGEPIKVALDRRARAYELAAFLRGLQWMNHRLGRPKVTLVGGSLGLSSDSTLKTRSRNWLLNSRFLPAFDLTPQNVETYVKTIGAARGGLLVGYASAVMNLAVFMSQRGLQGSPLASVICTAEHMPAAWRTFIRRILGCPVFCYYGCGEVNSLGYECADEVGYIVPQEHVILEVGGADATEFVGKGQGEACVTPLFNFAMPLLRYLNGDTLELRCPDDGRAHLRITRLEGRVLDQLSATDGRPVSGVLATHLIFRGNVPVWKYQLVQTERDEIVFHYLLRQGKALTGGMQEFLTQGLRRHLGKDLQVHFEEGGIENSASGKHRFTINRVPRRQGVH